MVSKWISLVPLAISTLLSTVAAAKPPNIVVILTDDQDKHMETVENMPKLQKHLVSQGASHNYHYCTVSQCCPSRVTMWTGRHAHNHNVTDVRPPYGGYPKVAAEGINDSYLPIWLQKAGYHTYYVGKLWNGISTKNYRSPAVKGFDGSALLIGPNTYDYWNPSMTHNNAKPVFHKGKYSTDLVSKKANQFLKHALKKKKRKPFFLVAAPIGPHTQKGHSDEKNGQMPPAAKRHAKMFQGYTIPRNEAFNPPTPGGAAYYKDLPLLNQKIIDYNDKWYRHRLRALQAVDDMVETLVQTLSDANELDNTYIIFTSDNGYHLSQHRMYAGKNCGLETDINIPFIVRGPGIAPGSTVDAVSSHVDLSPTIMKLAGLSQRSEFDGAVMSFAGGAAKGAPAEHVNVEHWGRGLIEGEKGSYGSHGSRSYKNGTFKSLRLIGDGYSFYYSVWCNGEHEFYDMTSDPYQLYNLFNHPQRKAAYQFAGRPFRKLWRRLDALLMVLKSCTGDSCRHPYSTLFPGGEVTNLKDAMDAKYDQFFYHQPEVAYDECALGYIPELEGPMNVHPFADPDHDQQEPAWMRESGWSFHI